VLKIFLETQSQFGMFANFSILFVVEASVNPGGVYIGFRIFGVVGFCIDLIESGWRILFGLLEFLRELWFCWFFYIFLQSQGFGLHERPVNLVRTRAKKSALNYPSPSSGKFKNYL
jgi:hypothetical protein